MKDKSKQEKTTILKRELAKINQHLPASVYIPFVKNSTRNYCVLHIPPEEARVFITKERTPIMISIEVFRPDEMALVLKQKHNRFLLKNIGKKDEFVEIQHDNPYFKPEEDETEIEPFVEKKERKFKFFEKKRNTVTEKKFKKEETVQDKMKKKADERISKGMRLNKLKNKDIIT